MSNSVLYDGPNHAVPFQVGPTIKWRDPETKGVLYKKVMRVTASSFVPLAISTTDAGGGWLVEESLPRNVGAGLVEWERIFAYLPAPRICGESIVYIIQQVTAGEILEMPISTTATVLYEYFHTLNPASIPLLRACRRIKVGIVIYVLGTAPAAEDTQILAEDSRLRRWRGNIYERGLPYVARASLTAA